MRAWHRLLAPIFPLLLLAAGPTLSEASAQDANPSRGQGTAQSAPDPDASVASPQTAGNTPEQDREWAWTILNTALGDRKHTEIRIQGLAALGLLGGNERSLKMILNTFSDPDVDIRTAAALAAGETKSQSVTTPLRGMLDDKEPQVAFAAASTLWKMNDRSGEDILVAVVDGERSPSAGVMSGTMHSMNRDLHNPAELARLGAMQGASMLLGPFGMGITAYEYMRKNGGDSGRVAAVDEIAENHTALIRGKLIQALTDKDVGVRTAAAKALGEYHDADVGPALANLFPDPKWPVRLTAAASYLVSTGAVAPPTHSAAKSGHKS